MSSIYTNSGQWVDTIDPDPETLLLKDQAHSLSRLCRFNGQCNWFYSVAEHALMVTAILLNWGASEEEMIEGLIHDNSEAYLGDVTSPLKEHLGDYRVIEARMQKVIREKFGSGEDHSEVVHRADKLAVALEAAAVFDDVPSWASLYIEDNTPPGMDISDFKLQFFGPDVAKRLYLDCYKRLREKIDAKRAECDAGTEQAS